MEIASKNPHSLKLNNSLNLEENDNPSFGFLSCSQLMVMLGNSGFVFSKKEIEFLASGRIRLNLIEMILYFNNLLLFYVIEFNSKNNTKITV